MCDLSMSLGVRGGKKKKKDPPPAPDVVVLYAS